MFHVVVAYRHPAGAWLAASHGGGVVCFSFVSELAEVVARRLRAAGLEARVEEFGAEGIARMIYDSGMHEGDVILSRVRPRGVRRRACRLRRIRA